MRVFWCLVGVVVAAVLVRMSLFTVDATELVYVTQLGRHVATYDGARPDEAGLHLRWPWPIQSVVRLDRRLQHFDLPPTEVLTQDPEGKAIDKTLTVEAYVCWRILDKDADPDAVDRFIRRMGTPDRARGILGQRLNSQLTALIGQMHLDDLISTETVNGQQRKVEVVMDDLRDRLKGALEREARQEYGLQLVDVRLRRFNHPAAVRGEIFERIKSERKKKVAEILSAGEKEASDIKSAAEEKVRDLLARARATERVLKGEADTEADLIRSRAHSKDPDFYVFLKKLEKMGSILGENRTLLLLSTHRPVFDLLFQPPRPNGTTPPGIPVTPMGNTSKPGPKAGTQGQPGGGGN